MNHERERPAILLAGGQPVNEGAARRIIGSAMAVRPNPRVAYIGAANGDRIGFFDMIRPVFIQAGAGTIDFVRLAGASADPAAAKETLRRADVVFLSGGEVEDGINLINKYGLAGLLRELFREDRQFIGVSAGTIMLGEYWVRWETPGDDGSAELFECLNIIPHTFDTHAEDEDWIELKTALRLMGSGARGYGLPRGGIVSARGDGELANLVNEYLLFEYMDGKFHIR